MNKGLIVGGILAIIIGIGVMFAYAGASDTEVTMRNQVVAQEDVCRANFDKMFKVIAQTAQVPEQFMEKSKEAFKEIYTPLVEGRYDNARGGSLMSWVTESNPQFDMNAAGKMYENLQVAIEANRQEYFKEQKKLIDIHREHKTYTQTFWNKNIWGFGDRDTLQITIVTSATTNKAYETGEENEIDLFSK